MVAYNVLVFSLAAPAFVAIVFCLASNCPRYFWLFLLNSPHLSQRFNKIGSLAPMRMAAFLAIGILLVRLPTFYTQTIYLSFEFGDGIDSDTKSFTDAAIMIVSAVLNLAEFSRECVGLANQLNKRHSFFSVQPDPLDTTLRDCVDKGVTSVGGELAGGSSIQNRPSQTTMPARIEQLQSQRQRTPRGSFESNSAASSVSRGGTPMATAMATVSRVILLTRVGGEKGETEEEKSLIEEKVAKT